MRARYLALAFVALVLPTGASGRDYNPRIDAFYDWTTRKVLEDEFRNYASELGVALAPKLVGPASTLGDLGFEVSLGVGLSGIEGDETYWRGDSKVGRPGAATDPGSLLITNQIRIRKGLPYSLQVGGIITHLFESDLWGIGLEAGWAVTEGFDNFPDVALSSSVNTVLGGGDLAMLEVTAGLLVSKSFSIAGLFSLVPYTGFNFLYINASSHLTVAYHVVEGSQVEDKQFAISQQHIYNYRWILGMDVVITYVVAGFEVTTNLAGSGGKPWTYAFKLGVNF